MDRNNLTIVGRVGNTIKRAKNVNGGEYMWIPVEIQNTLGATSVNANFHQNLNCMIFNKRVIDYVDRVKLKVGAPILIFGYIAAFKQTIKGEDIVSHAINVTELYAIKTRSDEEIRNSK